jgi:hypothetical protein
MSQQLKLSNVDIDDVEIVNASPASTAVRVKPKAAVAAGKNVKRQFQNS